MKGKRNKIQTVSCNFGESNWPKLELLGSVHMCYPVLFTPAKCRPMDILKCTSILHNNIFNIQT